MRIGVVTCLEATLGGNYQYDFTLLKALECWRAAGASHEFVFFTWEPDHPAAASLKERGWTVLSLRTPTTKDRLRQIVGEGPHREAWRWLRRQWLAWHGRGEARQVGAKPPPLDPNHIQWRPPLRRWLRRCGVELMIYGQAGPVCFEAAIPYVTPIHDLQHWVQADFADEWGRAEWEFREYYLRNAARYATQLLADSDIGKEDILRIYGPYGVTSDRVKVLPFLPAHYLAVDVSPAERNRVRAAHRLPGRYLFYPAQFWPQKNHRRIVEAMALLKRGHGVESSIVLCGAHSNPLREKTFQEVMALVEQHGLAGRVRYLGYVPDEDMSALYAEATALVMPTYLGPTNIPVLEAWAFGCPVLTSDMRGIREQVDDAGVLVDPYSVESIADGIRRLWTDDALRRDLAQRGRQRLAAYTPEDFRKRLVGSVEEAVERVRAGKTPRFDPPDAVDDAR